MDSRKRTLRTALLMFGLSQVCNPVWANETVQLSLLAGSESNVTRGLHDPHIKPSGFIAARVQAGKLLQLGVSDSLQLGATLGTRRYGKTSGFDQLTASLSATLSHKFGFGAYAHQLDLSAEHQWLEARGAARDRETSTLSLAWSKRLTPAWAVFASVSAERNSSDDLPAQHRLGNLGYSPQVTLPFELVDYDGESVSAGADYTFANGLMFTGQYSRLNGYSISSTSHPSESIYKIASAFYIEPAFANDWYAYRLKSNTDVFSAAISLPLAQDMAVDLMASWFDIAAPAGKSYDNSEIAIGLTWGF